MWRIKFFVLNSLIARTNNEKTTKTHDLIRVGEHENLVNAYKNTIKQLKQNFENMEKQTDG